MAYPDGYKLRTGGPHDSIKYPKVYRGLREHGFSKEAAARISNAGPEAWRRGGLNSHRGHGAISHGGSLHTGSRTKG